MNFKCEITLTDLCSFWSFCILESIAFIATLQRSSFCRCFTSRPTVLVSICRGLYLPMGSAPNKLNVIRCIHVNQNPSIITAAIDCYLNTDYLFVFMFVHVRLLMLLDTERSNFIMYIATNAHANLRHIGTRKKCYHFLFSVIRWRTIIVRYNYMHNIFLTDRRIALPFQ